MNGIELFDVSRFGVLPNEVHFPHPDVAPRIPGVSALVTRATFRHVSSVAQTDLKDDKAVVASMALSYALRDFLYVTSGSLQLTKEDTTFILQLIARVSVADSTVLTWDRVKKAHGGDVDAKYEFLSKDYVSREWSSFRDIHLTEAPTYNYVLQLVREDLPAAYLLMEEHPDGMEPAAKRVRKYMQEKANV